MFTDWLVYGSFIVLVWLTKHFAYGRIVQHVEMPMDQPVLDLSQSQDRPARSPRPGLGIPARVQHLQTLPHAWSADSGRVRDQLGRFRPRFAPRAAAQTGLLTTSVARSSQLPAAKAV